VADDSLTVEALLGELTWLRALARRLLDEHAADDASQATLLTALERRPDLGQGLRPWLTRVLRNLSLRQRRDETRRRRREDAVRRSEAIASTDEVVVRAAAQRAVVDAVMELAEPYRTTVLLRFFEELPPRAVAERMGVPVDTVHTRLRRALERLRERLDQGHADRAAWATPLSVWCGADIAAGAGAGSAWSAPLGLLFLTWKTKLVIAAVLVLAIGAAWFAFADRTVAPPVEVPVADVPAPAPMPVPQDSKQEPEAKRVDAMLTPTVRPGPQGLVDVWVVHRFTGAPASGAEVWYGSFDPLQVVPPGQWDEWRELSGDRETFLRHFGRCTIADAAGNVRLPSGPYLQVVARCEGECGELALSAGSRPQDGWKVEVQPDRTIRVQTVDADGHPVSGVPIGLEYDASYPGAARENRLGTTRGDDAMLVVHHLERQPRDGPWMITTCIPGGVQSHVAVDRRAMPAGPVQLTVPATARLIVQLRDPRATDLAEDAYVALDVQLPDGQRGRWLTQGFRTDANGRASLYVGVGSRLEVSARTGVLHFKETVSVPAVPGAEVVVRFTLDGTVLCGRAVDAAGAPLSYQTIAVNDDGGTGPFLRTDGQGRFRWYRSQPGQRRAPQRLLFHCAPAVPTNGWLWATCEGAWSQGDELDLGDLTFTAGPLVAAGQVFAGERPASIEDLTLAVNSQRFANGLWALGSNGTLQTQWTSDARFTVRGFVPDDAEQLRLAVKSGGMLPATLEFRRGSEGLRVELKPSCGCVVRFAHGTAIQPGMVVVRLLPADPVLQAKRDVPFAEVWRNTGLTVGKKVDDAVTEYTWLDREPGRYLLTLSTPAEQQPAVQREVALVAGRTESIDLELPEGLRLVTVKVVDEAGAPIRDEHAVVLLDRSDGQQWVGAPVENGAAVLLLSQPACPVLALAPHRAAVRTVVRGDCTVALQPASTVHVRLANAPTLPPGVKLELRVEPEPGGIWQFPFVLTNSKGGANLLSGTGLCGDVAPAGDGTFAVEVPASGPYRWNLVLKRADGRTGLVPLQPRSTEVMEGEISKEASVTASEDKLAEVLQQMAR
jgi:RNA polymerase sigma-70 factor (ECF subfamily)